MSTFHPQQNQQVDFNPACSLPDLPLSKIFSSAYLQNRTRPPFRPTPYTPYTTYDVIVQKNLPQPTAVQSALDHISLFPANATQHVLQTASHLKDFPIAVTRLVTAVSHGVKKPQPDFEAISKPLYTLYCLAANSPDGSQLVIAALSPRNDKLAAIDRVRSWARVAHAALTVTDVHAANGMTWSVCTDGLAAALINALIGIPLEERASGRVELSAKGRLPVPTDDAGVYEILTQMSELTIDVARASIRECGGVTGALRKLRDGWRPNLKLGKRGGGRRRRDAPQAVGKMEAFSDPVDVEWIKRRVATDVAREEMVAELERKREAENTGGDIGTDEVVESNEKDMVLASGGVYDDEPDEGVLEGEVSLMGMRDEGDDSDGDQDGGARGGSFARGDVNARGRRGGRVEGVAGGDRRTPAVAHGGGSGVVGGSRDSGGVRAENEESSRGRGSGGRGRARGRGGRGRGRGQDGSRGRGRGDSHHGRRDRAAQKQGRGM